MKVFIFVLLTAYACAKSPEEGISMFINIMYMSSFLVFQLSCHNCQNCTFLIGVKSPYTICYVYFLNSSYINYKHNDNSSS